MSSTDKDSDEEDAGRPHPLQDALDVLPVDIPAGTLEAAGRGLTAAGQAFETGVRFAAGGAGEILGRAGDFAGEAARAGLDVASGLDLGAAAETLGDVAEVAGEGLAEVAGALIEGIGSISN